MAEIVIAPGSVINEPSKGPKIKIVSQVEAMVSPPNEANRWMARSASRVTGRVEARAIMIVTKIGSV